MDLDGLTLALPILGGALCLALSFAAGACLVQEAPREESGAVGIPNSVAGLCAALSFACGFFIWACAQVCAPWLTAVLLAVLAALALLCVALGLTLPSEPKWCGLFAPVGAVFTAPARLVFKLLRLSTHSDVTEEEVLSLVDDVEEQDLIDETQKEMITNIFELDDVTAADVMTHRTELVAVEEKLAASDAVRLAAREGVSRMPIYRKSIDDIVGILYVKDLFTVWEDADRSALPVKKFMRQAMFVPEACRARDLLIDFRLKHTQIAVVVDEYGGTSGVVTMEDVLEEIVGNIQDEFDNEDEELVRDGDGVIASGGADLEDVFKALGLTPPEGDDDEADFESVSGLIIDRLGRIPAEGEAVAVPYGGALFTVLDMAERRVTRARCTPINTEERTEQTNAQEET